MARLTKPLTDTEIKKAQPKEGKKEYSLADGKGLYLRVKASGSKSWVFNYYRPFTNRRANIGLGTYPETTLKRARELRAEYRELLANNLDPKEHKLKVEQEKREELLNTFAKVSEQWLNSKKNSISESHFQSIKRSLEKDIFPTLGKQPVHTLKATDFIALLRPIEAKGSLETVKRLAQRINGVMNYAVNYGLIDHNPAHAINEVFQKPQKKHYPTLKPEQLPELMGALNKANIQLQTRCVIEWQLHTITRPSEASGARWNEIDLDQKLWTIPAERMKMKRDHAIPLSEQAIALLEIMMPISGNREHIFPSVKNPRQPMNSGTANVALKRMGFKGVLVAHGLRSLASTTLNEQGFNPDVIEAALSHTDANEVRKAYNRSTYLEQRVALMAWWSEHIEQASQGNLSLSGAKNLRVVK